MPNKGDGENDFILKMHHVKRFHASTIVFNVIMQMKTVRKQLLNELQQNIKRHQKIRKPMMTRPSVNNWLTRMLGNLMLDCDLISHRKTMKTVL
jgi:phosphoketolase